MLILILLRYGRSLRDTRTSHYAALGLDRNCTRAQIREAYRGLAKRHHPDVNGGSEAARQRTQTINAAYEVLYDPARRRAYDHELNLTSESAARKRSSKIERNISQDVWLRIEDFLRGVSLTVQVRDGGNPSGEESYRLHVPAGTAPGAKFRLPRRAPMHGGIVQLRVKVRPGFRFKARGSDLRCELRIDHRRALNGGMETMEAPGGGFVRVEIPAGVKRGEIIRIPAAGLPKPRGGVGDLLVRITYRPEVRVRS